MRNVLHKCKKYGDFLRYALHGIRQHVQLLVNPVSGLTEDGTKEHEKVTDFKHGIVLHRTAAYFMESGGVHIYLRLVGHNSKFYKDKHPDITSRLPVILV